MNKVNEPRRRYMLNLKTGRIDGYFVHADGQATGYDLLYAQRNASDIKTGFESIQDAEKFFKEQ